MDRSLAPVALFVYKRPDHTRQTLEALRSNPEFGQTPIFVYSDGPKLEADRPKVAEVIEVVRSFQFPNLTIIQSEKNRGLANSVIAGVTEVCGKFGRVIVVEDDLIVSPKFLSFMNEALNRYANDEKVMHISAYLYPMKYLPKNPFFYRNASSWGWGTWARAWKKFEPDTEKLLDFFVGDHRSQFEFDILGAAGFYNMLQAQARGEVDSWSIRWDATLFKEKGLSLYPARSLVQNIGMDGTGTHCSPNDFYRVNLAAGEFGDFPSQIEEDLKAVKSMSEFHRSMRSPLLKRILRRLRRILKTN